MRKSVISEYIKSFIYALIVIALLYIFLWPVRIVGVSMEPVLNNGNRIFVSRAMIVAGAYDRNDLVMIRRHDDMGRRYIIKRIIAKPGDSLKIENGQVFVNSEAVEFGTDSYVAGRISLVLADNYYFLMGDNHSLSVDSRDFGPLHRNSIRGRVLFRFMSAS